VASVAVLSIAVGVRFVALRGVRAFRMRFQPGLALSSAPFADLERGLSPLLACEFHELVFRYI